MATLTCHTDAPLTEMDFDSPTLTPSEMKKKGEMDAVDINAEREKGHADTPLMEMDFELPSLTPNDMKKKDKIDAVDVTTEQEKDFVMATQTGHTEAPLTEMDFDSPNLTPNEMKKKGKMDAVDVDAEQEKAVAAGVLAAGDECCDAERSSLPEVKLDDIMIKDLFVKYSDGKESAFHEKKARECKGCHLGGGSFGEVFKAVHKVHCQVAVKVAKPGKEDRVVMYQKEAGKHVHSLISPRIVAIRGFVQCDDDDCRCGLIGIVMEFMERGSLWDFRINNKWEHHPDPWPLTNRMVYEISSGMHFLHSKKIIHRDLKLENVLIDADLHAKIADLGLATNLQTSSGDKCWGTDSHKPPEAFRIDLPSSTKIVTPEYDVYSFAMTLYELLTGIHPYSERAFDMMRLLKVDAKQPPCLQPVPPNTPEDLKRIMIKSWSYEPSHRPDFRDITERVGKLDIKPTYDSLRYYLGENSLLDRRRITERDPIIIFDSSQLTDDDFEIKLHVKVTIPVGAFKFKPKRIIRCHERCKHQAYWQKNSRSLCAMLKSHEFTLRTLHLPPTMDKDCFKLLLCVSNKAALERLHSKKDLLPQMLFPFFVDRRLEELCSPVKPDLKVEPWEDQFNKGMTHFEEKEEAKSSSEKNKTTQIDKASKEKVSTALLLEINDVICERDVKSLGRHLGLSEVEVDNLVYSHRGERSSEIAYQVLNAWLQKTGQRATKAVLAEALRKAKCYDAAEKMKNNL